MDNLIKKVLEEIVEITLYNAYNYLSHIIGSALGDSIAIRIINKQGDILYEEDCLEQTDGSLDTLDDDSLMQTIVATEYVDDYYKDDGLPKKHRIIKPAIIITVE